MDKGRRKRLRITGAVTGVLAIIGALIWGSQVGYPDLLDELAIRAGKKAVSEQLRDPGSAIFRNVTVDQSGIRIVCGEVNGKNAWGGYGDYSRFIVDEDNADIEPKLEIDQSTGRFDPHDHQISLQFDKYWMDACKNNILSNPMSDAELASYIERNKRELRRNR